MSYMPFKKHRNFAVEIRNTRLRLRFSQQQFACLLDVELELLNEFEEGQILPNSDIIKDLKLLKFISYLYAVRIRVQRYSSIISKYLFKATFRRRELTSV